MTYCYSQFYNMCANMPYVPTTKLRTYNGCQSWQMVYTPGSKAPKPKECIAKTSDGTCIPP